MGKPVPLFFLLSAVHGGAGHRVGTPTPYKEKEDVEEEIEEKMELVLQNCRCVRRCCRLVRQESGGWDVGDRSVQAAPILLGGQRPISRTAWA